MSMLTMIPPLRSIRRCKLMDDLSLSIKEEKACLAIGRDL